MIESLKSLARTRILKLPEGNPPLPHGDPTKVETWNPDQSYLRYRLLGFFLGGSIGVVVGIAALVAGLTFLFAPDVIAEVSPSLQRDMAKNGRAAPVLSGLFFLGIGAFTLGSFAFQYVVLHLELDMLRYTLTDQALRLRRGVVHVDEVTLSFANIQNVKFNQGPVQRYFGIGDLIVETAGGGGMAPQQAAAGAQAFNHQGLIKGISDPERLRDTIQARVRRFKGSGLGADVSDSEEPEPEASGPLDFASPEATALLREIRDGLRATRLA